MTNRFLDIVVLNRRLDPVETELSIHVKVEHLTPTTQIRGRLLGPRCVYASTIEIAYPLREVERRDHIEMRALIPESSWWDPESPFLYEGILELWQDGALCDRAPIRHGIRTVQLTSRGLLLNGKPYMLRGKVVDAALSASSAQSLRRKNFNTLVANLAKTDARLWDLADRLGFFVFGTGPDITTFLQHRNELTRHPSNLGWIFNRTDFQAGPAGERERPMLYGVNTSAHGELPDADFMCCHERELAWLTDVKLPKLVVAEKADTLPTRTDMIGWIETSTT